MKSSSFYLTILSYLRSSRQGQIPSPFSLVKIFLLLATSLALALSPKQKTIPSQWTVHKYFPPSNTIFKVIKDPKNRIDRTFDILPYFKKSVIFWMQIYTQFSSQQVLLHDKNDLAIVYGSLDFSSLPNKRQQDKFKITRTAIKKIKKSLIELSQIAHPKSDYAQQLQEHLLELNIKKPPHISQKKFFLQLSQNIRSQTGQRDKIFKGILTIYPFKKTTFSLLKIFNVPKELIAIPFVESSFNPQAHSKANAVGVWQIMPFIGKKLFYRNSDIASRKNVLLSTLGALHLLKQNYKILNRWDLAITSYNSGFRHILKVKKKLKEKDLDLISVLEHPSSSHFLFASRNFYFEFLALAYVLSYQEFFFKISDLKNISINDNLWLHNNNINPYISKCGLIPKRLYSSLKKTSPHLHKINDHLLSSDKIYPRGTIIFSDVILPSNTYYKLSKKDIVKNYPKNYPKLIKNKKCRKL